MGSEASGAILTSPSISEDTIEEVRTHVIAHRRNLRSIPSASITEILLLLNNENGAYGRLEAATFTTVLEMLLVVERSNAKERGMFLAAVSIHVPSSA